MRLRRRPLSIHTRPAITFVCEHVGPWEAALKEALAQLFLGRPTVDAAFLARVDYGDGEYNVALCVKTSAGTEDSTLVEAIQAVFAPLFRGDSHLDIVFLTPESEGKVRAVCLPFYLRGQFGSPSGNA